jgi:hypothetical protein
VGEVFFKSWDYLIFVLNILFLWCLLIKLTFTRVFFFFSWFTSYYVRVLAWKICNGLSVSFLLWSYLLIQLKVVFNHGIIWLWWSKLFSCDVCLSNSHLWEWFFFSCSQLACKIPGIYGLSLFFTSITFIDSTQDCVNW